MSADRIWQILRYVLIAAGGWLASQGYITADNSEAIVGALGVLFTAGWGLFVKTGTKAVPADVAERIDVPTVSGVTGQVKP